MAQGAPSGRRREAIPTRRDAPAAWREITKALASDDVADCELRR